MKIVLFAHILLVFGSSVAMASDECGLETLNGKFDVPVLILEVISILEEKENNTVEITLDGLETKKLLIYGNQYWEKLKSLREEGDCIVYFITKTKTRQEFYGREGYILVRDGQPVYSFLTRVN